MKKDKKRGFSGEKLHKITISSVVTTLALLDIAPVLGVTSEYVNAQSHDVGEGIEFVDDLELEVEEKLEEEKPEEVEDNDENGDDKLEELTNTVEDFKYIPYVEDIVEKDDAIEVTYIDGETVSVQDSDNHRRARVVFKGSTEEDIDENTEKLAEYLLSLSTETVVNEGVDFDEKDGLTETLIQQWEEVLELNKDDAEKDTREKLKGLMDTVQEFTVFGKEEEEVKEEVNEEDVNEEDVNEEDNKEDEVNEEEGDKAEDNKEQEVKEDAKEEDDKEVKEEEFKEEGVKEEGDKEVEEDDDKEQDELTKADKEEDGKETNRGSGLLTTTYGINTRSNRTSPNVSSNRISTYGVMDVATRTTTPNYVMATDEDFSGTTDGEFRYIGSDDYVIIPHVINGVNVTSYHRMFEGTEVKGVASTNKNITDMSSMFYGSQATSLDLSKLDTSNVTDMSSMFYGSQATSLDLSNFDTSSVTDMSFMFYLSQATSLDLSNFDTSSVTDMSYMFGYSQATSIYLSSFDTSNVTGMIMMFAGSQATSLDLSSFDTSSVTDMSYMFYDSKATSIGLSNFDTSSVTNMEGMFGDSQATTLDLSSFDTSSVTGMDYMFAESKATIGYARTQEDADRFNGSSFKPSELTFEVMTQELKEFYEWVDTLPSHYTVATDEDFRREWDGNFKYIGSDDYVIIPPVIQGVNVTRYTNMFEGTSVKGVASNNKNVTNMSEMFEYSKATSLDLSNLDTSNVTYMSNMFFGSQATTLDLSSFDTSSVTSMSRMFQNSEATSLDLSSFDTSSVLFMDSMFDNSRATSIDLSSFDTSNVTYMSNMFFGSQATTLDLSSFDTSSVTSMSRMFQNSEATIGYARTQEDADRLNGTSFKPARLTFYVYEEDAPTGTITGNPTSWTNQDVTLTFNATDVNGVKRVQRPDGTWVNGSSTTYTVTTNGTYEFKAEDNIGNIGTYSVTVDRIDKENPNVEFEVNTEDWVGDKVELTVIAKDEDSGVDVITSNQDLEQISQETNGDTVRAVYLVDTNGTYEFTVRDKAGNEVTDTYTVENIDTESPKITVNGNPTDWFRDYELELEVITADDHSGVKQVTLPDGTVVTGDDLDTLTYKVTDNGSYEFIVEDMVGNKATYTEEVTMLEKEFSIMVTDTDNNPLAGAEFELYRDGELIETVGSDDNGLVEFGTVYTSGDYEVRQTRVLEGYRLNTDLMEVDVADDDITITNYLQSEELPSTGTRDTLIMLAMGLVTATVITVIDKKRRKLSK